MFLFVIAFKKDLIELRRTFYKRVDGKIMEHEEGY